MRKHERAWDGSRASVEPLETRTLMAADVVLEWNHVAVEATRVARLSPNAQTRALAMVQGAVFDAVNGIKRDYAPYLVNRHAPRWASEEAAVATAAHGVLVGLVPAQQAALDAALASSLAAVPDGRAVRDQLTRPVPRRPAPLARFSRVHAGLQPDEGDRGGQPHHPNR